MNTRARWLGAGVAAALLGVVLWLRGPSLAFPLWNVDEAIHATVARALLDGGVLYRDAVDLRAPLSYYVEAAVFAVAGENNLAAMRGFIALLIAGTAWALYAAGRRAGRTADGLWAAALYAILSTCLFYPVDAFASNTEWFVAFFTAAAAALFFGGAPTPRRLAGTGALLGLAFLSKQPALLELAAPLAALAWRARRGALAPRELGRAVAWLAAGWLAPVALAVGYFLAHGALGDAVFYSWIYNLAYYGPEITTADRAGALLVAFRLLLAAGQGGLLLVWLGGAAVLLYRLAQRQPTPAEDATNPAAAYLLTWSTVSLVGAASSGRDFEHYVIQFLPAFALGAGRALDATGRLGGDPARRWPVRLGALLLLAIVTGLLLATVPGKRHRTIPLDPSQRVAAYIKEHSAPADRIFVWGFQPEIYVESDRRAAGRFVICSFVTGLIPWTNVAPERDTTYAMVPGGLATLVRDLEAASPVFIVDCSVGPNRHWQKYPPEKYPALQEFIQRHYRQVEAAQFLPQGFRLFARRAAGEAAPVAADEPPLAGPLLRSLTLDMLARPLAPLRGSARYGASLDAAGGRVEIFAHAPSSLVYPVPAGVTAIRGGFGVRPGAYSADNRGPTDGVEFIVRWRPLGGPEQTLVRQLLRPLQNPDDRTLHAFRAVLANPAGGELEFITGPGPTGNAASDWSYWSDLLLETSP